MTAWGRDHELEAYRNVLSQYPEGILSIVIDSFDVYRAAEEMFGGILLSRCSRAMACSSCGPIRETRCRSCYACAYACRPLRQHTQPCWLQLLHPKIRLLLGDGIGLDPSSASSTTSSRMAGPPRISSSVWAVHVAEGQSRHAEVRLQVLLATVDGELRDVFKDPIADPDKIETRQARAHPHAAWTRHRTLPR